METVIIVESHGPAREALVALLGQEGFRVIAVTHPEAALVTARAERVDAILLEIAFPFAPSDAAPPSVRGTAAEAIALEIQQIHPRARVLFMTCERWTPSQVPAPVLLKPIDVSALLNALRAWHDD